MALCRGSTGKGTMIRGDRTMASKRCKIFTYKGFKVKVIDYQYKGREPIGATLGNDELTDINMLGEPCNHFKAIRGFTMQEVERACREYIDNISRA